MMSDRQQLMLEVSFRKLIGKSKSYLVGRVGWKQSSLTRLLMFAG